MRRVLTLALALAPLLAARPVLADPEGPGAVGLVVGYLRGGLSESYAPEDIAAGLSAIDRFQMKCHLQISDRDRLWLRVSRAGYQLADLDFPGTVHHRNETQVSLGDLWVYRVGEAELAVGPGYRAEAIEASNNYAMPDGQPGFFFTSWQILHGPALLAQMRVPLPATFAFRLESEWIPYAFMALADSRVSFPAVTSVWSSAAFTFWEDRLQAGYFYERSIGMGFDREAQGLLATLSVTGR